MLAHSTAKFKIAFICYAQSSKATSSSDSSVSYAAAVMTPL
jgi:predicted class III extradiol MEMO1 family dioxygenase